MPFGDILDDVFGVDPNGGGIFDESSGLIGGGQAASDAFYGRAAPTGVRSGIAGALGSAVRDWLPGVNPVTGAPAITAGGEIDITAPGLQRSTQTPGDVTTASQNPFFQQTGQLVAPIQKLL